MVLLLIVISFSYGVISTKFMLPPYNLLTFIWKVAKGEVEIKNDTGLIFSYNVNEVNIDDIVSNLQDNRFVRPKLLKKVILEPQQVKVLSKKKTIDTEIITANFYGITVNANLNKSNINKNTSCLIIYNQGHGGNPFKFQYYNELKDQVLEKGCDIISFSMLGLGLNSGKASFPTNIMGMSTLELGANEAANHDHYGFYKDSSYPNKDPLSLFLSGHYYIINTIINNYKNVSMVGISGGGWYTTWLSALIEQIDVSISYAGTFPLAYQIGRSGVGDYEQTQSQLYSYYDYWNLYHLATIGNNSVRSVYLVYNSKDPCCFADPYASEFKKTIDKIRLPNINVIIDDSDTHTINNDIVLKILSDSGMI